MAGYVDSDALVSAEWLAERLSEPEIRVVDSTWYLPNVDRSGRAEFESGHIPGARYWDIDAIADPNDPRPHMLPGAADFEAHMARLGIGAATRVVVYDRVAMMTAGRVWWMLRYFGHDAVSILDGGFAKWTAEDRPVEQGPVEQGPSAETGAETGAETAFSARPRPGMVRSLDQVAGLLDRPDAQILDARSPGRFSAAEAEPRPECRSGHIPGSMNLPHSTLVDAGTGTIRPAEALSRLYAAAGIDVARPVVTTCGSGVTACMLAFGLHLLGADGVAVYDGSWSEWGARADTPIEPAP